MTDDGSFGFQGKDRRAFELPAGSDTEVAPEGRARLRYNENLNIVEKSVDGGAYSSIEGGGSAGGWTNSGGLIYPTVVTHDVIIGAQAQAGSERLRVVGQSRFEVPDDTNHAVQALQGTDSYLDVDTRNGAEYLRLGNTTVAALQVAVLGAAFSVGSGADPATVSIDVPDDTPSALRVNGPAAYLDIDTTNGSEVMRLGNPTPATLQVAVLGGTFSVGAGATPTKVSIDLPDDTASALQVNGPQSYLDIATTSGAQLMSFGNDTVNPNFEFLGDGETTFNGKVNADAGLEVSGSQLVLTGLSPAIITGGENEDLVIRPDGTGLVICSGGVQIDQNDSYYLGDATTDGSWRIVRVGNDLSFQRRESSSWVEKGNFTAA